MENDDLVLTESESQLIESKVAPKRLTKEKLTERKKKHIRQKDLVNVKGNATWYICTALIALYCFSIVYVMYWLIISSGKSYFEYQIYPYQFPKKWTFENYGKVFEYLQVKITRNGQQYTYNFWDMFGTSFLFSLLMPIPSIVYQTIFAYGISTFNKYWYNKFLYNLGITLMIIPIVGSLPTQMMISKAVGTYNNLGMSLLLSGGGFSGMHFLMIYAAFKGVSSTYREACLVDGGSNYTAFLKLSVPLIAPTLFVFYILGFVAQWNSYEGFIVWFPSYANLAYGMYIFQNNISLYPEAGGTPTALAGFVIVSIPSMILYMLVHGKLSKNITLGGIKG